MKKKNICITVRIFAKLHISDKLNFFQKLANFYKIIPKEFRVNIL